MSIGYLCLSSHTPQGRSEKAQIHIILVQFSTDHVATAMPHYIISWQIFEALLSTLICTLFARAQHGEGSVHNLDSNIVFFQTLNYFFQYIFFDYWISFIIWLEYIKFIPCLDHNLNFLFLTGFIFEGMRPLHGSVLLPRRNLPKFLTLVSSLTYVKKSIESVIKILNFQSFLFFINFALILRYMQIAMVILEDSSDIQAKSVENSVLSKVKTSNAC